MSSNEILSDLSIADRLWKIFASVKLTIALLLTLAATSIVGTLIPQNQEPAAYLQAFGEFLYHIFALLGLFDMYHSWWFRTLILLLVINIIVCSVDRLKANRKILFVRDPRFNRARFRQLKNKSEYKENADADHLKNLYPPAVSSGFRYQRLEETDTGFALYAESGRWTRFGVYIVHLSVVILLIGGLIGSIFGFEGYVNIPEGETVTSIRLAKGNQNLELDFAIRCDDFNVEFYDSGAPKEFRSSLTVLKQGKVVFQKDIIVNDPLRYEGISFFQSSYGNLTPDEIVLNFTSQATGMIYTKRAKIDEPIALPEDLGTF
jgi:cytochrome c biogenesis protein